MLRKKIKELSALLEEEGLGEIEVRTWWRTIRVSSRSSIETAGEPSMENRMINHNAAHRPEDDSVAAVQPAAAPATPVSPPVAASQPEPRPAPTADKGEDDGFEKILAPMVGTFYSASNPDAAPFVSPGTKVEVGQVLCIIEAMKLMNEIESETSGTIRKVLAKDSQPVEFGQPLFIIE